MADYKKIIPFIRKAEGGLSKSKYDYASKYPSPCEYKGTKGWHTNKGITWATFKDNARYVGYEPTCENFIAMPDKIWNGVFKKAYWDKFDLDNYKSQTIADFIVSVAWGSGVWGATKLLWKFIKEKYGIDLGTGKSYLDRQKVENFKKFFNDKVTQDKSDEKIFNELVKRKEEFLKSLNQPANIKGWLSRLNKFVEYETNFLIRHKKTFIIAGSIALLLGGAVSIIISQSR